MFNNWYNIETRPTGQHKSVVPTAQIDWELRALVDVYSLASPQYVLEIGTQYGGTLFQWMEYAAPDATIVSIDTGPDTWRPPSDFNTDIWYTWAAEFGVSFRRMVANSHDKQTLEHVRDIIPHIDFLFIDGDHTYRGARKDFVMYGPLVRPGGIIAFHDLITPDFSPHIQIIKLWREIQAAGYKTRELRANAGYGGIGVVYV